MIGNQLAATRLENRTADTRVLSVAEWLSQLISRRIRENTLPSCCGTQHRSPTPVIATPSAERAVNPRKTGFSCFKVPLYSRKQTSAPRLIVIPRLALIKNSEKEGV